ncbi:uncharacterized protein [Rutidosis leptorrhynchoides]|uniref:uncharacterized protein n=1 Tax=Rutidosis leptorrhynchoides TaxID=125765 RepID=UPI003A9A19FD
MHQVRGSKTRLQGMRDNGWELLLGKLNSFCLKNGIEITNMDDPYYDGISRRRGSHVSSLHHYKVDICCEVIDMQLRELNNRFNEVNTTLLISMASLNPSKSFKAFQVEDLMRMADFYPSEFPKHELGFLRGQLMNYINDVRGDKRYSDLKGIGHLAKMMVETNKSIIYPNVYLLLKLALIFPVATSTVERAFQQ